MSKTWLTVALVSFLLAGCADSTADKEMDANTTEQAEPAEAAAAEVEEVAPVNVDATSPEAAAPVAQGEVDLNPPHGQPGHDCAIAVGAPLHGSGNQTPQATSPTFTPQLSVPSTQAAAPANGLNPPHGEPGHDCAVAVGAPLPAK